MNIKRKNRKKVKLRSKEQEILAPQYKNLMFEKRVHRGFLASIKTKKKLGKPQKIINFQNSKKRKKVSE